MFKSVDQGDSMSLIQTPHGIAPSTEAWLIDCGLTVGSLKQIRESVYALNSRL